MSKPITLYYHPYSRASTVVWMLEEVQRPYELRFVDLKKGEQKQDPVITLNPMGKVPVLVDGEAVVTEVAAIGLYLADRYALGSLAPEPNAPERAAYLRWSVFPAAVIEPASLVQQRGWDAPAGAAGWGSYDAMLQAAQAAIDGKTWLLGDTFSMADVIFGATIRYMLRFKMLEPAPTFTSYVERLDARPAYQAAEARHAAMRAEHGLE